MRRSSLRTVQAIVSVCDAATEVSCDAWIPSSSIGISVDLAIWRRLDSYSARRVTNLSRHSSLLVFIVILGIYRLITYLASRSQRIENILEGEPIYIIEDGMFSLKEEGDSNFAQDEFFAEMRAKSIEHLGQVRTAVLESNGQISFLYFDVEQTKPGMPVFPKPFGTRSRTISNRGLYACTHCGQVLDLCVGQICNRCHKDEWVCTVSTPRIA